MSRNERRIAESNVLQVIFQEHFSVVSQFRHNWWSQVLGISAKTRRTIAPCCSTGGVFAWLCEISNFEDLYTEIVIAEIASGF